MRILLALDGPEMDSRMRKEVRTLRDAGHEMHILLTRRVGMAREEMWEGVPIHRWVEQPSSRIGRLAQNVPFRVSFRSRQAERAFAQAVQDLGIQVIHVVNLPYCRSALHVTSATGVWMVADFFEYFPGLVHGWSRISRWQWFKNRFFMSPARWKVYEREVLEQADAVICVAPRIRAMWEREGVNVDKVRVIELTPVLKEFDASPIRQEILDRYRGNLNISYIGLFFICRGLEMSVKAMTRIREAVPNAHLIMGGKGTLERRLRALVHDNGLDAVVDFPGWISYEDIRSYYAATDIGICPLEHTPHHDVTLANKVFDHMAAGVPNLVSDCGSLKDLIEETGSGLVFRAGDMDDYIDKVLTLARDPDLRKRLGENGRRAAERKYNWETSGKKLIDIYGELASFTARKARPDL